MEQCHRFLHSWQDTELVPCTDFLKMKSLDTTCFKIAWDNKLVSHQWYFSAFIRPKVHFEIWGKTFAVQAKPVKTVKVLALKHFVLYGSLRMRPTWPSKKETRWPILFRSSNPHVNVTHKHLHALQTVSYMCLFKDQFYRKHRYHVMH